MSSRSPALIRSGGLGRPSVRAHPAQGIFAGGLAAAAIGTVLLMLPFAKAGPGSAPWNDALFTAVSALSITGLVTVDTGTYWTGFGHAVILTLIQIGGIGIMTFASFVGLVVIRRMSFQSRLNAAAETKAVGLHDLKSLVAGVVLTSLVIELVVATILTIRFIVDGMSPGAAAWSGIFHGVSSFNSAGFALASDSLAAYVHDPVVSLTVCVAVILGGLGFPVLVQLRKHLLTPRLWTMNTRLVLAMTALILPLSAIFITVLEWDNPRTLGAYDPGTRILAGFFQAVQTRSSGFTTVDVGEMHGATLLGMDAMMFIGAGPAGTGGGIKVTTFGVLLFILIAEIRGDGAVNVFGKRLSRAVHRQAMAVVLVGVATVVGSTILIMLITPFDVEHVLFEVISAFATVGLSTGITSSLPEGAQVILCVLMFLGRLGPITFATALALRRRTILYQLPKERPIIG